MDLPFDSLVAQAAQAIGVNPDWLKFQVAAESAWNPFAFNKLSGATGLIQFMPRTAKGMNIVSLAVAARIPSEGPVPEDVKQAFYKDFIAKFPTVEAQLLGPVVAYYKMWRPFPTEQSFYLSTFYPKYRNSAPDTVFPDSVQAQNPGIKTVGDYVAYVKKKSNSKGFWRNLLARLRSRRP